MRIEAPEKTLQRFANDPNWLNNSPETIAADLKSSGNESRREWDTICYEEKNGKLFDPIRNDYIANTDGGDPAQKNVNQELERWFLSHESGIAVRISPSGGMYHYPDEQIEIYRITYEYGSIKKRLFGSLRQFHAHLKNPEKIRQFIFTEEDSEEAIFKTIDWVEKVSEKHVETTLNDTLLRSEQAYNYAIRLKSGEDPGIIFQNMRQTGFLGGNPIGCGGSNINQNSISSESFKPTLISDSDYHLNGWHDGTCRVCGRSTWVGPCNICKPCESKF